MLSYTGAGQSPSQSVSVPQECPVDISRGYLRYWRAGVPGAEPSGKFRNSPKAGSGAEWLATLRNLPVSSPPLNQNQANNIFPTALSTQNGDDGGFVVQELTVKEREQLHIP